MALRSMATEKLYWVDPLVMTFDTAEGALSSWDGHPSIVLGATRFYPEAGGQLGDTGWLAVGGSRVTVKDTQIADNGEIHHIIDEPPPHDALGGTVHGEVQRDHRLDQMAHHTAQHLLSAAFAQLSRVETVSARLGRGACTVDLDAASASDGDLARAEDLVNAVIRDDVTVRAFFPSPEELANLHLRRAPKVAHGIRVIDIEGFDQSPCGGTHCTRTGQVGVVRVVGDERYKGKLRITFHAAARAVLDMRTRDGILATLTRELTCGAADLPAALGRLKSELRASRDSLGHARAGLARLVADDALARHPARADGQERRIVMLRESDDVDSLRLLAGLLSARPDVVAVCVAGGANADDCSIIVQRGTSSTFDCGVWLKRLATAHGGRGGGRPERAEGRIPRTAATAETLTG